MLVHAVHYHVGTNVGNSDTSQINLTIIRIFSVQANCAMSLAFK